MLTNYLGIITNERIWGKWQTGKVCFKIIYKQNHIHFFMPTHIYEGDLFCKETNGYSWKPFVGILQNMVCFSTWSPPNICTIVPYFMYLPTFVGKKIFRLDHENFRFPRCYQIFFPLRRRWVVQTSKIRQRKASTVRGMTQDFPIEFLKLITDRLGHIKAGIILL